jgi:primosomal protein N''
MTLLERIWHWLTTTPYTRLLESQMEKLERENLRIAQENLALHNTLLARVGALQIDPATMHVHAAAKPGAPVRRFISPRAYVQEMERRDAEKFAERAKQAERHAKEVAHAS